MGIHWSKLKKNTDTHTCIHTPPPPPPPRHVGLHSLSPPPSPHLPTYTPRRRHWDTSAARLSLNHSVWWNGTCACWLLNGTKVLQSSQPLERVPVHCLIRVCWCGTCPLYARCHIRLYPSSLRCPLQSLDLCRDNNGQLSVSVARAIIIGAYTWEDCAVNAHYTKWSKHTDQKDRAYDQNCESCAVAAHTSNSWAVRD